MTSLAPRPRSTPTQAELDAVVRRDFAAFLEKSFNTLHPPGTFQPNWHIDALAHRLDQARLRHEKRLIINLPPRSLKSEIASVALAAFIMGHNPAERIVCVSYSQTLSSALSRSFRRILEADWYQRIFPNTKISKDTEEMIETTAGGARLSTSIGGSVTGLGGNVIIIDDPMKPDEAPSEAARDKVIRYYRDVLSTRLDDKINGAIILVMQRLHEDDLSGYLLRQGGWSHLCLPAIATHDQVFDLGGGRTYHRKADDILHPERESKTLLNEARLNLGGAAFAAQYQQSPMPAEGNTIKRAWLKTYTVKHPRERGRWSQCWDTALKGDPGRDFSVCTTWVEIENRHFIHDVFRARLEFPELVKAAAALHAKFKPDALLIEDQGSGTSLIQELRSRHSIYSIPRRSKADKETRLAAVAPMFEAGQVFIPEDEAWLADLVRELCGFPNVKHDDQVDSVTQYLLWARERGSDIFNADFGLDPPGPPSAEDLLYWLRRG